MLKIPLFEYEISQDNQLNKLYRILVWIDNQGISPDIPAVYDALFGSVWTRHKIEYVYQEGRESYIRARKAYSEIEAKIKEFKQDKPLEELQKLLESIPEISLQYQQQLRNLQGDYTAIKVNHINHRNYLNKIGEPGDVSSWRKFEEITCKRYLDQIETHLSYIQPGKDLIGEFINTLRGLVEIEQTKFDRASELRDKNRDRNLQITIAVVGIGIGVAGVVSSSYTLAVEKPWAPPSFQHPLPLHPFFASVIVSCLCGGILGGLAWLTTRKLFKPPSTQTSLPGPDN